VKPLGWFLNVVPRTLRAFLPALARPDDAFAREVLRDAAEYRLYLAMDPRDRHHAVAVARAVLARDAHADDVVVRAAILHDVGKSVAPYRAWERIAVHLYTPGEAALEPEGAARWACPALRSAWHRHRHHAERGAALIVAAGGDPRVADLVARHHERGGDPRLALIAAADAAT
jgi:putative nucleotidyltransferase with HDIG domain